MEKISSQPTRKILAFCEKRDMSILHTVCVNEEHYLCCCCCCFVLTNYMTRQITCLLKRMNIDIVAPQVFLS